MADYVFFVFDFFETNQSCGIVCITSHSGLPLTYRLAIDSWIYVDACLMLLIHFQVNRPYYILPLPRKNSIEFGTLSLDHDLHLPNLQATLLLSLN